MPDTRSVPELVDSVDYYARHLAGKIVRNTDRHTVFDYEDMLQEARLGAVVAAHRYDPEAENNFLTYASSYMSGYMKVAYRKAAPVAISSNIYSSLSRADRARLVWRGSISMDAPVTEDGSVRVGDSIPAETDLEGEAARKQAADRVRQLLSRLTDREAEVLCRIYGMLGYDPMNGEQIGAAMGITRARVSQLHLKALEKLKKAYKKPRRN